MEPLLSLRDLSDGTFVEQFLNFSAQRDIFFGTRFILSNETSRACLGQRDELALSRVPFERKSIAFPEPPNDLLGRT